MPAESRRSSYGEGRSIGQVERTLILKTFPGFAKLSAASIAVMSSISRERFFPAGTVMHEPNRPVLAFHLIVEGKVQTYVRGQKSQVHGQRAAVGGLASLTGDPRGLHAVAIEDVVALEIDKDDMRDVFEDHFDIAFAVIGAMARTLRELQMMQGGAAMPTKQYFAAVGGERPLTFVERLFFLRKTSAFREASIDGVSDIAERLIEVRYEPGDVVFRAGDEAEWGLIIAAGEIEARPPDRPPFCMGPGFIVGGLDSMGDVPRWYDAVAKGHVIALQMLRTVQQDVLEDHMEMAVGLLENLARGVSHLIDAMAVAQGNADD